MKKLVLLIPLALLLAGCFGSNSKSAINDNYYKIGDVKYRGGGAQGVTIGSVG